jgi:hypothetical protein
MRYVLCTLEAMITSTLLQTLTPLKVTAFRKLSTEKSDINVGKASHDCMIDILKADEKGGGKDGGKGR